MAEILNTTRPFHLCAMFRLNRSSHLAFILCLVRIHQVQPFIIFLGENQLDGVGSSIGRYHRVQLYFVRVELLYYCC